MKEQILYFYQRNNKPCYIIKLKGNSESMFSGNNADLLSNDLDNLDNGEYTIVVANHEKGFSGQPEKPFTISSKSNFQKPQTQTVQQNVSFEDAVQKAYEKGQSDLLEKQKREEKEAILDWLITHKPTFEKMIKDLSDDDDTNDEAAKSTFMDVIQDIPDAVAMLGNMMNLGSEV
jgi:hypothetical protein